MDYGHGVECLCESCCRAEIGSLTQDIGFFLLGVAAILFVGILAKEKFNIRKVIRKFF